MNTSRTLALAAITALSLGMGTAMAQSDGASAPNPSYGPGQQFFGAPAGRTSGAIQSGSSDVDATRSANHGYGYDYGTMADPG
jgi:hypothetical protein